MSFSAHADSRGILQLINQCKPKNVIMVHGEPSKMKVLSEEIRKVFDIDCYDPPNGGTVIIPTENFATVELSSRLTERAFHPQIFDPMTYHCPPKTPILDFDGISKIGSSVAEVEAVAQFRPGKLPKILDVDEAYEVQGLKRMKLMLKKE